MLSFITSTAAAVSANAWVHDWSTTASSTFADFNPNTLLTDAQAKDVASKFRVISRACIYASTHSSLLSLP